MPSQLTYRQSLAKAADDWGGYGVVAGGVITSQLAAIADAATADHGRFNGAWVYSPTGGDVRRVKKDGFDPANAMLTITGPAMTLPTAGSVIEITRLFPALEQVPGEDTSYRTIINHALALLVVPRRISFAATVAYTYSMLAYPWLDRESRIVHTADGRLAVFEGAPIAAAPPQPSGWRGWKLILSGGSTVLSVQAPFIAPTDTVYLDVMTPADTFINGAESAVGLATDTDTAVPSTNDVTAVGLMLMAELIMARSPGRPAGTWAQRYPDLKARAEGLAMFDRSQARPAPVPASAAA